MLAVAASDLISAWNLAPGVLAYAFLALVLFGIGCARLRRRGRSDHAGAGRVGLFVAAVGVATLALVSPLDLVGERYLLSGHMLQHVLIGDAAPALLVTALRGPLLFFLLPAPLLRVFARSAVRAIVAFLLRPVVSFALWAATLAAWHVPAAYEAALRNGLLHDVEHFSFALGGLLVWTQLVDPARRGRPVLAGRFAFAFLLFVCGQALSYLLVFSFDPLYPAYAAQDERLFGLSPLSDQKAAGLVMMVEQTLVLGIWALVVGGRALRDEPARRVADERC